jgi:Glycoside hydrolase family 44/Bacterial Ig-like domain (group 3)
MRYNAIRWVWCGFALAVLVSIFTSQQVFAQSAPTLTVDATGNPHPINADIYGIANYGLDPSFSKEIQIPNIRWGGDATTRYNWQVDSSNAGFDWYFMGGNGETTVTPSGSADTMIRTFQAASNAKTLLTIPIIPYVNKMAAWNCSFPVSVYGPQQSTNPYVHPNGDSCGNSISTNGTQLLDTNIYANHIDNSVALQQGWVQHLIATFGTAANGGVPYYQLDNEPGGWSNTHRDVEPVQPDYDTIISLGQQYAAMIKQTDPSAKVFGPVDFTLGGWIGTPSKQDGLFAGQYYLQQMAAYEKANGQRILDYFDEHYYGGGSTDAAELESTRALWDSTFNSGSWVEQWYFNGPMQLIPRFESWIQTYYPGTKLSISEYYFGSGTNPLVDMLTETDVLGIYGRQGLDFANMWNTPKPTDPIAYSFRIYRNYDGAGSQFGDTSVTSASTDQSQLSVYGALRSSDGALTVVAINKTTSAIQTTLTIAHYKAAANAAVYTYSNTNLSQIVAGTPVAVASNVVNYVFPAYSATVMAFTPQQLETTTTTLSASNTQVNTGQSVTFTSKVAPSSGNGNPSGMVTFNDGGTPIGTGTVTARTASFSTSELTNGRHSITAAYSGDASFEASSSSPLTVVVSPPAKTATNTSVKPSATQLTVGQTLTLGIEVAPQSGSGTPTGSVTVLGGNTQLGVVTLTAGGASFSTNSLTAGTYSLAVNYSGDANFAASTSAVIAITVSASAKVNTNTSLSISTAQITAGSAVTLTAQVAATSGTGTPSGTISFLDSGTTVASATLSNGSAQVNVASLTVGPHTLTATYSGDTNFNSSTSSAMTITVVAASTADFALSVSSTSLNVAAGSSGELNLTVTPKNGFKQAVSFACSGLPSRASCSFSPQSLTPTGSAVSTLMTVQVPQTTAAAVEAAQRARAKIAEYGFGLSRSTEWFSRYSTALCVLAIAIVCALGRRRDRNLSQSWSLRLRQATTLAAALAIAWFAGGCASIHTQPASVLSQSYTVTITAGGNNAPTHSQTITLTVRQ